MYHSAVFALEGVISAGDRTKLGIAGVVVVEVKNMDEIRVCTPSDGTKPFVLGPPVYYPVNWSGSLESKGQTNE